MPLELLFVKIQTMNMPAGYRTQCVCQWKATNCHGMHVWADVCPPPKQVADPGSLQIEQGSPGDWKLFLVQVRSLLGAYASCTCRSGTRAVRCAGVARGRSDACTRAMLCKKQSCAETRMHVAVRRSSDRFVFAGALRCFYGRRSGRKPLAGP
jgi:hypothetical protein